LGATHSEVFVILACTVLIKLKGVTDRQTNTVTMAKTREALRAVARKNARVEALSILALRALR